MTVTIVYCLSSSIIGTNVRANDDSVWPMIHDAIMVACAMLAQVGAGMGGASLVGVIAFCQALEAFQVFLYVPRQGLCHRIAQRLEPLGVVGNNHVHLGDIAALGERNRARVVGP